MFVKKWLSAALAAIMMLTVLASCSGERGTTSKAGNNENTGVRYNENNELLYLPEDVGEPDNPIVTMLIAPGPTDDWWASEVQWREDAYGLELKYDSSTWNEREMKWISAYVSGTPYDIFNSVNFPTTAVKGLIQPLDDILPVNDERYFVAASKWQGKTYGVKPIDQYSEGAYSCSGVYGVFFNKDLFEENGETLPSELWERGEWDFQHFYDAAKNLTLDTDRDGKTDTLGVTNYVNTLYTVANGASTVTITDTNIELTWNTPAYIEGLEWMIKMQPYQKVATDMFYSGKAAMFVERIAYAKNMNDPESDKYLNFEYDWVPYPKGPSGYGYSGFAGIGSDTWTCYIGTNAKNVEGAKMFICADIARGKFSDTSKDYAKEGITDEILARVKQMTEQGSEVIDLYAKIGSMENKIWDFWGSVPQLGAKGAIEKFTNTFQKEIDTLLETKVVTEQAPFKSPGTLDFEDGNTVLKEVYEGTLSVTDKADEVISGSKSLKIQLKPDNDYGPVAVTTKDNFSMPYGGQYKITFRAKAVGGTAKPQGTLVVALRPFGSLETKDDSETLGGWNPVDLSDGQVHDFELMINVLDFYDDLQLFLIGNTDESAPDLAIIIDDLAIEEIK